MASRDQRMVIVDAHRADARVALDAILERRADYDDDTWKLVNVALMAYRLAYPKTRATAPWHWMRRHKTREAKVGDLYCLFCGELLVSAFERGALQFLRGVGKLPPSKQRELGVRVYPHTTPCALQFLAGMREAVAPGTRRLPEDVTHERAWDVTMRGEEIRP